MTIYFLGGGNMAEAIISGLVKHSDTPIHVANRGEEKRLRLQERYGVGVSVALPPLQAEDVLVLAVKPQDMQAACAGVQTNGALVLSVAAGLSLNTLSSYLGGAKRLIRIMPNTPGSIGLGVSGMFAADGVSHTDKRTAETIMAVTGEVLWLDSEEQMHSITGISGSGPAYVFYLLEALQQAALEQGFDDEQARMLSLATFKGAVALAEAGGEEFSVLRQNVTSKGGTTFAALETFGKHGVAEAIQAGVAACVARSREIATQFEHSNL